MDRYEAFILHSDSARSSSRSTVENALDNYTANSFLSGFTCILNIKDWSYYGQIALFSGYDNDFFNLFDFIRMHT